MPQKYDIPMTIEENCALVEKKIELYKAGAGHDASTQYLIDHNYALTPRAALAMKNLFGFKVIAKLNLSDAKKAYPDEF